MTVRHPFISRLLVPRHKRGRLVVLLVPVAILGVVLKLIRVFEFYPESTVLDVAARSWSELAFGVAWVLLWGGLAAFGARWWRTTAFYLAHLASCVLGIFLVIAHQYVMKTGNPLTLEQMQYAWQNREDLGGVLGSETDPVTVALIVGVAVFTLVLPGVLGGSVSRLLRSPSRRFRHAVAAGAGVLLAASAWSAPTISAAFALAAPVQLVVSPIREAGAYPETSTPGVVDDATGATTELEPAEGEQQRNLVIITLESQRATSTLPETSQPVTPVLDALAAESLTPSRGYSLLPHTSKALTAIHCGITPPPDHDNTEADEDSLPVPCLPELLGDQGYETAFLQSATQNFERRRGTAANLGFGYFKSVDSMDKTGFGKSNYFGYEDDIMLAPARQWLESVGDDPFMLTMLTVTGHHDYRLEGYEVIHFVEDPLLNSYLNAIHYQDAFVGHVIDMFKEMGLYEETVFVVVGDHGEGFGEHRIFQHDNTIYEEGIRVPYLIHDPLASGVTLDGPANQLAILPTAVDAIGFDLVSTHDYAPSLLSGEAQGPLVATCWERGSCTAVIDGDLKLIHHFGDRRDEVFDVAADPYETEDLVAEADPEWVERMRELATQRYVDTETWYATYRADGTVS